MRRDEYKSYTRCEWICDACGMGYRLEPSARYNAAQRLFKEHRAVRFTDVRVTVPGKRGPV